MIKRVIRWITAPTRKARERLEAQRVYDQLVETMRNEWTVVQTHRTRCFTDTARPETFLGEIIIVAETNELNERRVRCINRPFGFSETQSREWGNYQVWALNASPTMPPRKPVEIRL